MERLIIPNKLYFNNFDNTIIKSLTRPHGFGSRISLQEKLERILNEEKNTEM